ncbi:MAG: class I SAM-dependent methyltransferase [Gammaproteobacteria bacterium]|nr:class I SAM-dependent methyltransferase [Gammaproteobacteria bacterium]
MPPVSLRGTARTPRAGSRGRARRSAGRILEVGTGGGGIAHYFGTHPTLRCDVTAVDVHDIREIEEGYRFVKVEGVDLPFDDQSFDLVITNHVIEHVGDYDDQLRHLGEIHRVMKVGGSGYLAVPNCWMLT